MGRMLLDHIQRIHDSPVHEQAEWTSKLIQEANRLLDELVAGRPIQYVLNEAWFDDRDFFVNESVLIPRPETEELLDWIKRDYAGHSLTQPVLDIGTGSGILAISLKRHFPEAAVQALDISADALAIAQKNAKRFENSITSVEMDFTQATSRNSLTNYALIVSNPPYIALQEHNSMPSLVTEHEPHLALFTPDEDPLLFYRCIAEFGKTHLQPNGKIFVELHEDRSGQTKELFEQLGYRTTLRADMQGKWRMLRAERN